MSVNVGDKVTTTAEYDVNGTHLASFVRTNTYDVIQVNGSRVVIGKGKAVTAAVDISTLTVVGGSGGSGGTPSPSTPVVTPVVVERVVYKEQDAMSSQGIEDALTQLIRAGNTQEMLKYNMRLFGLPAQFTEYCDYRTYTYMTNKDPYKLIGRKFIENIMLEAPVITIVPGKPVYLPASKNKQGTSYALLSAANGSMSALVAATSIQGNENTTEKLRYYDFEQDYYSYMKYVNILCAVAASFLDLQTTEIDGTPLTTYDWKNYRWNADKYKKAVGNIFNASVKATENAVNSLKTYGQKWLNALDKESDRTSSGNTVNAFEDDSDKTLLESLESVLTQLNFVQFYVDASSGVSESNDNTTAASKLEGILDSGSELFKEIAFLANSGGIDASEVQDSINEGVDTLNEKLLGNSTGSISGVMSRILSAGSNVIKGDNMIFPEIYQSSKYNKNYSIIVDLRCPYGNKLSYYLNILVPLFHLIALAIPKQTTANTYGSPFLVKAYYPGVFSCNLGIVSSISIDKNTSGDSWTIDGFPSEVKVTLNIIDLYSDLSITPAGDIMLFLSNSSLIEYIATSCGVNLVVPQLSNRVNYMITIIKQSFSIIDDNISNEIFKNLENFIASLTGV